MIKGCKKTLDFYKISDYCLLQSDIGDITNHVSEVDAIATDLPYGKATTTKGEAMNNLYLRAFEIFGDVLKERGRLVVGLSDRSWVKKVYKNLKLLEIHELRAHRSLTRYFAVFKKQP
jgi:tRNA (guanine10-N2)-dimethyltransferase